MKTDHELMVEAIVFDNLLSSLAATRFKLNSIIDHVAHSTLIDEAAVQEYARDIIKTMRDTARITKAYPQRKKV